MVEESGLYLDAVAAAHLDKGATDDDDVDDNGEASADYDDLHMMMLMFRFMTVIVMSKVPAFENDADRPTNRQTIQETDKRFTGKLHFQ